MLLNDVPVDTFSALGRFKSEKLSAPLLYIKRSRGPARFTNEIVVSASPDVLHAHFAAREAALATGFTAPLLGSR